MTNLSEILPVGPSTTWAYRKVKVEAHPQGIGQPPKATSKPARRRRRDIRGRTQIVISYRGGPEASWLFQSDGTSWRYPGHWCLHDALSDFVERRLP